MAAVARKTLVATGCSSGIGFELVRKLLSTPQPSYSITLAARKPDAVKAALAALPPFPTGSDHSVSTLQLDLNDLRAVRSFAHQTLDRLGPARLDYLLLNACEISHNTGPVGPHGSRWSSQMIVNYVSQQYLVHLLRDKMVESGTRLVISTSGGVRNFSDPSKLESDLKAGSKQHPMTLYTDVKFVLFLATHWWRRALKDKCVVVTVSPGLIYDTGIARHLPEPLPKDHPDAKQPAEGAKSLLAAFTRDDMPADPDQIFLSSWGEWFDKSLFANSLDRDLQERWSFSKEQIEREGLVD